MTAPAHWYPVAAVGALLLTASAILGTGKIRSHIIDLNDGSSATEVITQDWTRAEHLHNPADLLDVEKAALIPSDSIGGPIPPSPTNGTSLPENLTRVEVSGPSVKTGSNTVRLFPKAKITSTAAENQALNSTISKQSVSPTRSQGSSGGRTSSPPLPSYLNTRMADINMSFYSAPLGSEDEREG